MAEEAATLIQACQYLAHEITERRRQHNEALVQCHNWDRWLVNTGGTAFLGGALLGAWSYRQRWQCAARCATLLSLVGLLVMQHKPFSRLDEQREKHAHAWKRYNKLLGRVDYVNSLAALHEVIEVKKMLDRQNKD
jgi:hypothetical protein